MKGRAIIYSAAEMEWIKANSKRPRAEMHSDFIQLFDRRDVSVTHLKSLCKRNGWMTGRTGCFERGVTPHNKGKPMPPEVREKCMATAFKPGNLPHNHRGHGHERIDTKNGYVVMIVAEKNPWTGAATRPVHKHRYLWEKKNGPVPKGHVLKCLDGDKTNTDPQNWEAVPRGMLPKLNARWRGVAYDTAAPELRPTIMAAAKLEHAIRERKRNG